MAKPRNGLLTSPSGPFPFLVADKFTPEYNGVARSISFVDLAGMTMNKEKAHGARRQ